MKPLLEYDRVTISYNGRPAVQDVSVSLSEGEILGVVFVFHHTDQHVVDAVAIEAHQFGVCLLIVVIQCFT